MKDVGYENQKIFETYENSILTEAKKGFRRKVQLLDDRIDDLIDDIEKKIDKIDDNPTFQRKMYQELSNTTKEHSEFLMAMKRVASALDSGAKVIASSKGKANPFGGQSKAIDQEPEQPNPQGQQGPPGPENGQEQENNMNEITMKSKTGKDIEYFILGLNYLKSAEKMFSAGKDNIAYDMIKDAINKLNKQLKIK